MPEFPPRGFGAKQDERPTDRRWADQIKLGPGWNASTRKMLLGEWEGRLLGEPDRKVAPEGSGDDRHIVTIAGSRAGKSQTVLIPNLLRYPGSLVVIDPKGELVKATADVRQRFGQVHILDPFGITGRQSSSFNPFLELTHSLPGEEAADAAIVADALIIDARDAHWTDSAKNLIRGLLLHKLATNPSGTTIKYLRRVLSDAEALSNVFEEMMLSSAFDGTVANIGLGFLAKREHGGSFSGELRSIISTATEQTWPLEDIATISERSDFSLSSLTRAPQPTTIYLVLPATRLATHSRWLRLFVNLAIAAIERNSVRGLDQGALPVWLVLEEFAALGHMRSIETAAGFMAGLGCRLWVVLQDLTQLKTHYPNSWETFLGNAGIIQAWGNVDATTTEYLSKLLGNTTIIEIKKGHLSSRGQDVGDDGQEENTLTVPLLEPAEISFHFAREKNRQMILVAGRPPIFIHRLPYKQAIVPNS